jgi:rhamnulokinase/L-fuculokinase
MLGKIQESCRKLYGKAPETVGEITRCVYDSLAMKYRYVVELLEKLTGKRFKVINMLSGGSRDRLMCSSTASACVLPLIAGPSDASALGNIIVQLLSAGAISSIKEGQDLLARSFPPEHYEPEDSALWDEHYRRFREILPALH